MVVTGSGNCRPLAFSTKTTFALIISLRYVAVITRFSISKNLMLGFMRPQAAPNCAGTVRSRTGLVNHKLCDELYAIYLPARAGLRSPARAFSAARLISDA